MNKKLRRAMAVFMGSVMILSAAACNGGASKSETKAPVKASENNETQAGDTKSNETQPEDTKTKAQGETVTLVYAGGADSTGATQEIIDAFEKEHQNIKIQRVDMPADQGAQHDAYVTSFAAGGTDYDIIDSNVTWPAEFAEAGYVLPIDTLLERDGFDLSDFVSGYVDAYTFKGRIWGLPCHSNAGLLYYRSDIIETPPTTWDELYEMAETHLGEEGTKFGYVIQAAQYEGLICNAIEFIASEGGRVVDDEGNIIINNDGVKSGLEIMKKFVQAPFSPENVTTFKEADCTDAFAAGDAIFMRNWPGVYATLNDPEKSQVAGKVGIAALPSGTAGSYGTIGGWGVMINKNTEHVDEAWEFLKFKAGMEGQKINAVTASQPPLIQSLYKDADIIKANPFFELLADAVENGAPRPVSPVWTELSEVMQIEISKALAGTVDINTAVETMDKDMKAIVEGQ